MKAEIREFHSPDVYDLSNFVPDDGEKFAFLLQVMVGPEGEEGEESFDIEVCTPKWLAETYDQNEVVFGRHRLIVFKYDFEKISSAIRKYIGDHCTGDTWEEVAEKIARIGHWEFEDYTE